MRCRPKKMTHELVEAVRSSGTIDWNLKDSVKAAMRSKVRRLLTKYDYPPDNEEEAVELVLQQAELFARQRGRSGLNLSRGFPGRNR